MSTTVRISNAARKRLKYLSLRIREPMLKVLDKAYATLRSDKKAWQQEQEERAAWDTTLTDGIEGD